MPRAKDPTVSTLELQKASHFGPVSPQSMHRLQTEQEMQQWRMFRGKWSDSVMVWLDAPAFVVADASQNECTGRTVGPCCFVEPEKRTVTDRRQQLEIHARQVRADSYASRVVLCCSALVHEAGACHGQIGCRVA
jgi:hypothetical protein